MSINSAVSESRLVRLEGDLTVETSAQLKQLLVDALLSQGDLELELTNVTTIDVTALQLFWAAAQEAKRAGKAVSIRGPLPDSVNRSIAESGLESLLNALSSASTSAAAPGRHA